MKIGEASLAKPEPGRSSTGHPGPETFFRNGAVFVLTYAHAGTTRLLDLLAEYTELAITAGTGFLPLCGQAAAVWRQIEGHPAETLSPLAAASVRTLVSALTTTVLARQGKARWCEAASAPPHCADTFLNLYPNTKFLCLQRSCQDVVRAAVIPSSGRLGGREFASFVAEDPDSRAAAAISYWAAMAESLLNFEAAHPMACRRVRYEDLTASPAQVMADVGTFLGLQSRRDHAPLLPGGGPAYGRAPGDTPADGDSDPAWKIPSRLMDQADKLLDRLGYPALTRS